MDATPRNSTPRRTDTSDPRRSRQRALRVLFQADVRGVAAARVLEELDGDPRARTLLDDVDALATDAPDPAEAPLVDGFTRSLVLGVEAHRDEVDQVISRFARRWSIMRMPTVDRTVLRLATYELAYEATPPAVVIDEAVTAAKTLSTDDSGRYVNGVLEAVRRELGRTPDGGRGC